MHCFRLSHAGLVVENESSSLFIDVGNFSDKAELEAALLQAAPLAAIIVTHEHPDHWTIEHINAMRDHAPAAPIFTTEATAQVLGKLGIEGVTSVFEGETASIAGFDLEFYGRRHEQLHSSMSIVSNIGVQINSVLAWGGDSLERPPFIADLLGIPIGAPWSNIGQVMDFALNSAPKRAFFTHDGMLSARGAGMYADKVGSCVTQQGGEVVKMPHVLKQPGERMHITA